MGGASLPGTANQGSVRHWVDYYLLLVDTYLVFNDPASVKSM
jgi:hypothetical protein